MNTPERSQAHEHDIVWDRAPFLIWGGTHVYRGLCRQCGRAFQRDVAQGPLCGQDTREANSRVTVQCALPAGHAGMCSAEEEDQ